ncbi:MAG: hypothetical protein CMM50_04980 [Rhodospirillaceae bacterium]|nr:hypothetical protein [Rhodospirillaceae bacterium]
MQPVHIVAEDATTHAGSVEAARRLIDMAKRCGADSVKFQIINPEGLYLPVIWTGETAEPNPAIAMRRAGQLPESAYRELADHGREAGIPVSASVFDTGGLALLKTLDPPYVKIASTDLDNHGLLRAAAGSGLPMLLSTGMATLDEVVEAVAVVDGTGNKALTLLHCTSVYPCPPDLLNMAFMDVLRSRFDCSIGFSDHSRTPTAAVMAVAKGAAVIEKHVTLNRAAPGPDNANAMDEDQFSAYVAAIREAEAAMGPREPKVGEAEASVASRARRSLYAARALRSGEVVTEADLLVVRPAGPAAPPDLARLLGRKLKADVPQYRPVTPESVA